MCVKQSSKEYAMQSQKQGFTISKPGTMQPDIKPLLKIEMKTQKRRFIYLQ